MEAHPAAVAAGIAVHHQVVDMVDTLVAAPTVGTLLAAGMAAMAAQLAVTMMGTQYDLATAVEISEAMEAILAADTVADTVVTLAADTAAATGATLAADTAADTVVTLEDTVAATVETLAADTVVVTGAILEDSVEAMEADSEVT